MTWIMVLILEGIGNLEIARKERCFLICLKHLIRSKAVTNRQYIFFFMRAQNVLRQHNITTITWIVLWSWPYLLLNFLCRKMRLFDNYAI